MQYTLRNVPEAVDRALRLLARREGKSINEVAVAALVNAVGLGDQSVRFRSLADLSGSWKDDPEFDEAIANQQRIDEATWR